MKREKNISRKLSDDARVFFKKYENNRTRRTYTLSYRRFINFCRAEYNVKNKEECEQHVQDYINHLKNKGYTASTIHTYLASICMYHGLTMQDYKKPHRYTSEYKRGRTENGKAKRKDSDLDNPEYRRLVEFQKRVGIRRAELKHLRGNDFAYDESGNFCVLVRRGKGGKQQFQCVLPKDVEFVKSYFDGSDNLIFSEEEMKNKLTLHYLRAKHAQECYEYYLELTQNPEKRKKLEEEVGARWNKCNINPKTGKPKYLSKRLIEGDYFLRGKPREFAIKNNLPIRYNKLALLSTSILHLSHFRNDVTVLSYLLVV